MKKVSISICTFLLSALLMLSTQALADSDYVYTNDALGFSLYLPVELMEYIEIEENDAGVDFIHKASAEAGLGGLLGSLRVKTPKSAYFSDEYYGYPCRIIAVNRENIYVFVSSIGGVGTDWAHMDGYNAAFDALAEVSITVNDPESIPGFDLAAVPELAERLGAQDGAFTRAEAAEMMYALISADSGEYEVTRTFTDVVSDAEYAKAVSYLAEYGIVSGYPDGSFRPEAAVTRAEFVKLLHKALFIPYPWWYGEEISYSDVTDGHWAWEYLNCACQAGWLVGDADSGLRPDSAITRTEAATALERLIEKD